MIAPVAALSLALLAAPPATDAGARPWVGVQLGSGTGGWRTDGRSAAFGDLLARDPLRLSLALEGSCAAAGSFLGGVRLSSLYLRAGGAGTLTVLHVARLEAAASWRPLRAGPYARLGMGPAVLRYDARVPGLASGRVTASGAGVSLAAGASWPLADRIELRLEAEGAWQAWLPSSAGPDLSWTLGGAAGLAWR